jgi:hypothetical protein
MQLPPLSTRRMAVGAERESLTVMVGSSISRFRSFFISVPPRLSLLFRVNSCMFQNGSRRRKSRAPRAIFSTPALRWFSICSRLVVTSVVTEKMGKTGSVVSFRHIPVES